MVDECPMIEDCPAYDHDRGMCLVAPGDCEFSPPDPEAAPTLEAPEAGPAAGGEGTR